MDLPFGEGETLVSTVLVVDDEATVLDVFTRLLSREPKLSVQTATTAEGALFLLRSRRFDLLITDKNLPGMGGIELIAGAKELRPEIEAIMITGYASAESVIAAFAAGASDYVVKPFEEIGVVRAKVHAALDRRKERAISTEESHQIARDAAHLIGEGKTVDAPGWHRLEKQLEQYELAIRTGAWGTVLVVGSAAATARLEQDGLEALLVGHDDPKLETADVVVIDTGMNNWMELVARLGPLKPDLLLTAGSDPDLGDLLEAIALKLELVGTHLPGQLTTRVRAVLMQRAVQEAKKTLVAGLAEFRNALAK